MTDRYENIREALAMGPTPGEWYWSDAYHTQDGRKTWSLIGDGGFGILSCDGEENSPQSVNTAAAELIAACDPDTIRELLAERDALAAALEAAREDACVSLVADIRFACGDNGTRMQPELVEFIRELAKDAERYRWLRDSQKVAGSGPEIRLWNRDEVTYGRELHAHGLDAAIDQARGRENGNG